MTPSQFPTYNQASFTEPQYPESVLAGKAILSLCLESVRRSPPSPRFPWTEKRYPWREMIMLRALRCWKILQRLAIRLAQAHVVDAGMLA